MIQNTTSLQYTVTELTPYVNWVYFFHAWGFAPRFAAVAHVHDCAACRASWLDSFPEEERAKAKEAAELYEEAKRTLAQLEGNISIQSLFRLCEANADGDNIVFGGHTNCPSAIGGAVIPLLRQQTARGDGSPYLCLSDFVRPLSSGRTDIVGLFASSVQNQVAKKDPYCNLLLQTLTDRMAEAATEKMHLYVRREAWGYAPDENLSIPDLLQEKFQGIRPAVGYPSLPDQSVSFLIDQLLGMKQIGITLTENGAMHPHSSVCGLMLSHPAARYFSVGRIDEAQLRDYARRRGLPVEKMRKFLAANL